MYILLLVKKDRPKVDHLLFGNCKLLGQLFLHILMGALSKDDILIYVANK